MSSCGLHYYYIRSLHSPVSPAPSRSPRRTILQDQKRKLRCFDTVCAGRDRLPGSTSRGTGAAQAAALPTGARKGAGAVIGKLLSKVREDSIWRESGETSTEPPNVVRYRYLEWEVNPEIPLPLQGQPRNSTTSDEFLCRCCRVW